MTRKTALSWYLRRTPTHYALGASFDSPCGIYGMQHRGTKYTRMVERTTCGHCRRWLAKNAPAPAPRRVGPDVAP